MLTQQNQFLANRLQRVKGRRWNWLNHVKSPERQQEGTTMQKLKNKMLLASLGIVALAATPASAAVTLTSTPGTAVYSGPTPTYNFDTPTPQFTGGVIRSTSPSGISAQPFGSTGGYATVGPSDGTPGILDLSSFGDIDWISFIWGSIDNYNTLEVLSGETVLASFTGTTVIAAADGDQTDPATNRLVKLTFTGGDQSNVTGLRFKSTSNAFEFDNVAVAAVPEPAAWMVMMLGMAGVGFSMRRKKDTTLRVRFA